MQTERFIISDADVVSRCRAVTKPGLYSLLPRANRVLNTLPCLRGAQAQVLSAPPVSIRYVAHELLVSPGGGSAYSIDEQLEQFLYVLEGEIELVLEGKTSLLNEGGFCWLPPKRPYTLKNPSNAVSRILWLRRGYQVVKGLVVPEPIISNEKDVVALPEDTYMEQHLVPYENPAFDMGYNLLTFEPGIHFGFVESHIMEHALYMLVGRGIYWLNGDFHEVQKDDFIYMAPYCPQFFYATGWEPSRYLVYKDVNRDYPVG